MFGPPVNLEYRDAQKLTQDARTWISSILGVYAVSGTALIKEESIDAILPDDLLSRLDEMTRNDLKDALTCILLLIPTPAVMICFRATENILRRYYSKLTGKSASSKSWAELLKELEQSQQLKPPLLGYLRYLKDKRNEAEHPDKRFSQEESERIFLQIKGLLDEIGPL